MCPAFRGGSKRGWHHSESGAAGRKTGLRPPQASNSFILGKRLPRFQPILCFCWLSGWFLIDPQKPELGDVAPGTSDSRQGLASLFNMPYMRQYDAETRIAFPRLGGSVEEKHTSQIQSIK